MHKVEDEVEDGRDTVVRQRKVLEQNFWWYSSSPECLELFASRITLLALVDSTI